MASNRSSKKANLVARLPWHPSPKNCTNKLEDTAFYKELCDNDSSRGKFREKLYQFYNDTTRFYLPVRYVLLIVHSVVKITILSWCIFNFAVEYHNYLYDRVFFQLLHDGLH